MAPVRSLEETWLYKVVGAAGREVDASVCQAVAVQINWKKKKKVGEVKRIPQHEERVFMSAPLGSSGPSSSLTDF